VSINRYTAHSELNRVLQSLACARLRPLTKHPKGRDISPTDKFSIHATFTDPKYRVKINTVQLKETPQENKETHERVAADRNFECQAAIVRILKARKKIGHSELISEVIDATRKRGAMQPGDIKRNIERLIEKEYLERIDPDEGGGYAYVA
jgi:cullin 4